MRNPLNLVVLAMYLVNCLFNFDVIGIKIDVEIIMKQFVL